MEQLEITHELHEVKKTLHGYYQEFGEEPSYNAFPEIHKKVINGCYAEFGIECWLDLLAYARLLPNRKTMWKGYAGLEKAKEEALNFFTRTGKVPRAHFEGFSKIATPIYNGYWKRFGINSWGDFLEFCGIKQMKRNKEELLIEAMHVLIEMEKELGRMPTIADMPAVFHNINRGMWEEFGIVSWNDFVFWAKASYYNQAP